MRRCALLLVTLSRGVAVQSSGAQTQPSRAALCRSGAAQMALRIDSHLHVWSDGEPPYPWEVPPPEELRASARAEVLVESARRAGISGALIVQPVNHKFDHSYVTAALERYPDFFRGMMLANPSLPAAEAVAELEVLQAAGYVGVRFNPSLFPDGIDSEVGRSLYKRAGELGMSVGLMCFGGLLPQYKPAESLIKESPETKLIIDHFGFFRQPATGGLLGPAATDQERHWDVLLKLSRHPQVYVKLSALFRVSGELPPHGDLIPRIQELVAAYGPHRLMWGSDFPYVTIGGNNPTEAAMSYGEAAALPAGWIDVEGVDEEALEMIRGGTAAALFGFPAAPPSQ